MLIQKKYTGLMSVVQNLKEKPENWVPAGFPLISMMNLEDKGDKGKIEVIKKYLVELDKPLFMNYEKVRDVWALEDYYQSIGPLQFEFDSQYLTFID